MEVRQPVAHTATLLERRHTTLPAKTRATAAIMPITTAPKLPSDGVVALSISGSADCVALFADASAGGASSAGGELLVGVSIVKAGATMVIPLTTTSKVVPLSFNDWTSDVAMSTAAGGTSRCHSTMMLAARMLTIATMSGVIVFPSPRAAATRSLKFCSNSARAALPSAMSAISALNMKLVDTFHQSVCGGASASAS